MPHISFLVSRSRYSSQSVFKSHVACRYSSRMCHFSIQVSCCMSIFKSDVSSRYSSLICHVSFLVSRSRYASQSVFKSHVACRYSSLTCHFDMQVSCLISHLIRFVSQTTSKSVDIRVLCLMSHSWCLAVDIEVSRYSSLMSHVDIQDVCVISIFKSYVSASISTASFQI